MKKRALLVNPSSPDTYWSLHHSLKFVNKKSLMPPLGLMTVAAMLPDHYDIKFIDLQVGTLNDMDIEWADMVFITAMIVQKESFLEVISRCRKYGKTVVAGGPYPTSSWETIEGVDYFILGEGENTLPRFLEDFEKGKAEKVYSSDDKPDMKISPVPRYDLVNVNNYRNLALQFSRGCPHSCEFCDVIEMFGRIPRLKSTEQFLKELDCVYETGYRGIIFIVDDNFIGNRKEVIPLLKAVTLWQKERSFPFSFYTEATISLAADTELLDLLAEAGIIMLLMGIETPDENVLISANKAHNTKHDLLESAKIIQSKGIEIMSGFIVGFDTDREDIFDRQINFIQEAAIPGAMVGLLLALPGTQLYKRLQKEGRILHESSGDNTTGLDLNFVTIMVRNKIIEGYKKILKTVYTPKYYFDRSYTLISRLPAGSYKGKNLPKGTLTVLLKSLIYQSFSWYGHHYIKFIVKVLLNHRSNFPRAVSLAIKGHHFFYITNKLMARQGEHG